MQCERREKKQSIIEKKNTTTTTTKTKNTLHIDFNKQTNVKTYVCICPMLLLRVSVFFCFYNQNLVIRSTFVFFGVVEEFEVCVD